MSIRLKPSIPALIFVLQQLPRLPYREWITILSGLAAEFGIEEAYNIALAAGFKDEKQGETLYKLHHRLKNITFGSVVHLLRTYRIETHSLFQSAYSASSQKPVKPVLKAFEPQSYREAAIYSFKDEEAEERAAIQQFDAGMSRIEAERCTMQEFPAVARERVYRCAWSDQSRNKEILIPAQTLEEQWNKYVRTFRLQALTLNELIASVRSGYAIIPCVLKGRKGQKNWVGSELCFVDVDDSMTVEEAVQLDITHTCLFLHTTYRHRKEGFGDRFRIVFALQGLERQAEVYRALLKQCIAIFRSDASCSDITKSYFGNTDAQVWTPKGGWMYA